jgi:sorting nexin-29
MEDNEEENVEDGKGEEEEAEEEVIEPPTKEEVEEALKEQKLNKAPGDNIPAELLKALHRIINKVWEEEKIPEDWRRSIICPIFKKGDKLTCSNYRGISLLSSSYKILSRIIKRRLDPYIEETIGEYQSGFRPNRSTIDNLFTLRQIREKCWEYNIYIYLCFIDFKQAYDTIIRKKLRTIMSTFGIPTKLRRIINLTMTGTINQVKIQNQLKEGFKTNQGFKQRDSLAPSLFNLVLEYIVRKCNVDTIAYQQTQIMAYVDNIIIVSRSLGDI